MQENRLLSNYWWMLRRRFGGPRMAFWGHGRDFQTNAPGGIRERWKSATIHQVDWWFAYTPLTVRVLEQFGYPSDRITCLYNAIDTRKFREEVASIDETELAGVRRALGWGTHPGTVAIFCGSLYPDKRLDLLVSAADLIRADLPDFKLIVIGDGSSAAFIKDAVKTRPWCAYVGPKRGRERAKYFRLADVTLNPGLVGLHVLDSFAAGLPIITTRGAKHSPEIAYVVSGWNGLLTGDDAGSYAAAVSSILSDRRQLDELKRNAALDAQKYTTERMARNFLEGMLACLARPKKRGFAR
jgi:glycosyltransferase involved in cell wall biosynthesis